ESTSGEQKVQIPLRWQAVVGDQFHLFAKTVQLSKGGVDVGRDPDALEFLVYDRRGKDVVFVEHIFTNRLGICAFDVNVGDGARLIRIKRSVEANPRHILEPVHPVTRQVTQ